MFEETFTGTVKEFWIKYEDRFYYDTKDNTIKMKKKKQSLSDKVIPDGAETFNKGDRYKEKDVKEAIKELIDSEWIKELMGEATRYFTLRKKVKEIFGLRLI